MADARNEFTNLTNLRPEAIGEPGKRTFRIVVDSGSGSATFWLEKEQLFQLSLAIQQLLATLPESKGAASAPPLEQTAPGATHLDFKIGKLALGHDRGRELFIIDAHDADDADEDTATVRVWASREQVNAFADEALRVCAAGRPLCPLCGRAIDPTGHQCPRVNGQVRITDL